MGHPHDAASELLKDITVLVIEDDADAREIHHATLTHAGAAVLAVRTATRALSALERVIPDVLLSDLRMPRHDGYWLIRKVRALPPERGGRTPAIAITGYGAYTDDIVRSFDAGFDAHLSKPVDWQVLPQAILRLVERDRSARPARPHGFFLQGLMVAAPRRNTTISRVFPRLDRLGRSYPA